MHMLVQVLATFAVVALLLTASTTATVCSATSSSNFGRSASGECAVVPDVIGGGGTACVDPPLPALLCIAPACTGGPTTNAITMGDVDGDGDNDLIYARTSEFVVARNTNGKMTTATYTTVPADVDAAAFIRMGDLDGDGDLDLLFQSTATELTIAYNLGGGSSWSISLLPASIYGGHADAVVFDVDSDGTDDIVFSKSGEVLWSTFSNSFSPATRIINSTATKLVHADIDADSRTDLIVVNGTHIGWYRNLGGSLFNQTANVVDATRGAKMIATGDLRSVGLVDIITATADVVVYFATAPGSYAPGAVAATFPTVKSRSLAIGHFRSGSPLGSIVVSAPSNAIVFIHMLTPDGIFATPTITRPGVAAFVATIVAGSLDAASGTDSVVFSLSAVFSAPVLWVGDAVSFFNAPLLEAVATTTHTTYAMIPLPYARTSLIHSIVFIRSVSILNIGLSGTVSFDTITPSTLVGITAGTVADVLGDGEMQLVLGVGTTLVVAAPAFVGSTFNPVFASPDLGFSLVSIVVATVDFGDVADVVAVASSGDIVWMRALPPPTFGPPTVIAASIATGSLVVADLNGDAWPDLVFGTSTGIGVIRGASVNGTAWSAPELVTFAPGSGTKVAVADLNGDGALDAVVSGAGAVLGFFLGFTNGSFDPSFNLLVADAGLSGAFTVGDLHLTGYPAIVASTSASSITVFRNDPSSPGSFSADVLTATQSCSHITLIIARRSRTTFTIAYFDAGGVYTASANTVSALVPDAPRLVDATSAAPPASHAAFGRRSSSAHSPCFVFGPNRGMTVACLSAVMAPASVCARDTILVSPGEYTHCPRRVHTVLSRAVTLKATGPTTIRCGGNGVVFSAETADGTGGLILNGINVDGTSRSEDQFSPNFGLRASGPGSFIRLVNATVSGALHGALSADDSAKLILSSAVVRNAAGAGITVRGQNTMVCMDGATEVAANGASGVVASVGAVAVVVGDTVVRDNTGSTGAGISVRSTSCAVLDDRAAVTGNTATASGGGIGLAFGGSVVAGADVVVAGNSAAEKGGGVFAESDATVDLRPGVTLTANTAGAAGGGLYVAFPASAAVDSVVVSGNSARFGGGIAADASLSTTAVVAALATPALPIVTSALPNAVALTNVVVTANSATVGPSMLACGGGGVVLAGPATVVDGRALVCLPQTLPGAPLQPTAADAVPWITFDAAAWAAVVGLGGALDVTSPPAFLALGNIDLEEGVSLVPGVPLSGSATMRDVFGAAVRESAVEVAAHMVRLPAAVVEKSAVAVSNAASGATGTMPLPDIAVTVANVSALPVSLAANAAVVVSVRGSTAGVHVEVKASVGLCPPGRGAGVDAASGRFTCVVCSGETFSATYSTRACFSCPVNSYSVGAANETRTCFCAPGHFLVGGEDGSLACPPCPVGATCSGAAAQPVAAPGYFAAPDGNFPACPRPGACRGGSEQPCHEGYEGFLCNQCSDGYYTGTLSNCLKCPATSASAAVSVLVVAAVVVAGFCVAVVVIIVLVRGIRGLDKGGVSMEDLRRRIVPATLSMVVVAFQVVAVVAEGKFGWSRLARGSLAGFSIFLAGMNVLSSECALSSFHVTYVYQQLVYALLIGSVMGSVLLLRKVGWPAGAASIRIRQGLDAAVFTIGPLLYIPVGRSSLVLFDCSRMTDGSYALDADPGEKCFDSAWFGVLPLALVSVVVYVIGLPAYSLFALVKRKNRLARPDLFARFGALYRNYRFAYYWAGVAELGKRLGIVIVSLFFSTKQLVEIGLLLVILLGSAVATWRLQPYYFPLYNQVDVQLTLVLVAIVLAGFGSYAERGSGAAEVILDVAIVCAVLLLLVLALYGIVRDVRQILLGRRGLYSSTAERADQLAEWVQGEQLDMEAAIAAEATVFVGALAASATAPESDPGLVS